jgi:hypothetical protein
LQTVVEGLDICVDDELRINGQRVGVDGCHEDRRRTRLRIRNLAEGAGLEGRPQAGSEELIANLFVRQRGDLIGGAGSEVDRFLVLVEPDDDRLQHAACATVDRHDFARARRGEENAWQLLVFEEGLPQFDLVTFRHVHGGLEIDVINADDRHVPD